MRTFLLNCNLNSILVKRKRIVRLFKTSSWAQLSQTFCTCLLSQYIFASIGIYRTCCVTLGRKYLTYKTNILRQLQEIMSIFTYLSLEEPIIWPFLNNYKTVFRVSFLSRYSKRNHLVFSNKKARTPQNKTIVLRVVVHMNKSLKAPLQDSLSVILDIH